MNCHSEIDDYRIEFTEYANVSVFNVDALYMFSTQCILSVDQAFVCDFWFQYRDQTWFFMH